MECEVTIMQGGFANVELDMTKRSYVQCISESQEI